MKKALSILLSSVLLMTVIIAVPFTASAATDREIDLSKSQLLITSDNTAMTYDTEGGILKLSAQQWYWDNKPIRAVGSKSTWCKEIGLKYEDGALAQLESGKRYAVTLNYTFVNNNGNSQDARNLPQIAIGYDSTANASSTSAGNFYVAAVKNHVLTDKENSYYLSAVIEGKDKPLRIAFSGVWKFEINSILLQEIDATAENQVTVVYCDGGEYKAEFAAEGGALKTPVKDGMAFAGWYLEPDFSGKKVTTASADAVLYAKWAIKTDLNIDLSNSNLLTTNETTMTYEGGILKFTVANWYGAIANKQPIKDVGSISTTCKEIGLRDADNALVRLESGKKYAVTLNYKFVNNNNNNNKIGHLPQIAIGYDSTANASSTSAGNFYVAAVKNHVLTDKENSYYLSAVIEGKDKPLRIAFSGVWKFEINSILLQEIDADAENQVTVVYCDGGEYKAEFETEGGALKTPVKDGMAFAGWYLGPDFSGAKVTTASADVVVYAKWINPIEGDLNEDGVADIRDLVMLKEAAINQDTDMKYDLDGDSKPATEDDLLFLKKLLLGITV